VAPPTPSAIELCRATRSFGRVLACDRVDLAVAEGEFFAMLGPSGSGKTTCLRLIAGFEQPDSGAVLLDGIDVSGVPPYERNVNTVFQDYALFPHLSVRDNVAYGLMVRKVGRAERAQRADAALERVKLGALGARKPSELSGGQRQRVALARALINKPRVLLLDEPLGALDLKLREAMQVELKALQRELGITFVYVTHDQGEALSMADRVAVFDHGRIVQLDAPRALYTKPRNAFVATFVGGANVLTRAQAAEWAGIDASVALRPEQLRLVAPGAAVDPAWAAVDGRLRDLQFHGATCRLTIATAPGFELVVAEPDAGDAAGLPALGASVRVAWPRAQAIALEAESP
jgi:putative spermidine/putrescine transport system ATP-binding protein